MGGSPIHVKEAVHHLAVIGLVHDSVLYKCMDINNKLTLSQNSKIVAPDSDGPFCKELYEISKKLDTDSGKVAYELVIGSWIGLRLTD